MDESAYSMFGNFIGSTIGRFWGPIGGLIGGKAGTDIGNFFGSWKRSRREKEEREKYLSMQQKQANILREKIKADNAGLYSAVQSSVTQTSGAMGAIY